MLPGEDPTYWSIIEIDDAAVEASDNVQYDYFDYLITCRSEKGYAQAVGVCRKKDVVVIARIQKQDSSINS
ncbi:MAG: hypothetical protein JKP98_13955 [Rhodobacteraceae bacterium]|nr:hypothetical protein [Paracoccaceae bacterium]